jgi:hypothetical protein
LPRSPGRSCSGGDPRPGVPCALTFYTPFFTLVTCGALRSGLVTRRGLAWACLAAGTFHTLEAGPNVFRDW